MTDERRKLSTRAFNTIANQIWLEDKVGLGPDWTIEQLRHIPREVLAKSPNCGMKTLAEICSFLAARYNDEPQVIDVIGVRYTTYGGKEPIIGGIGKSDD